MSIQDLFKNEIQNLSNGVIKEKVFNKLLFKHNWNFFRVDDGVVYFVEKPNVGFNDKSGDLIVNKIKIFIKKYPIIFSIIFKIVGISFLGKSSKKSIENLPKDSVIINLGSGPTKVREDIINIDFYPFKNVDLVADISNLPFSDNSIDAVICEHVLEHVFSPKEVISEIYRVLKPNGIVYIVIPFVMSFHSSPYDYYRWSKLGLREDMKDFKEIDCGVRSGPGGAVNYVLAEYLAILFSFGINKLHQVLFICFLVLLAPLAWLDYIIGNFKTSENIAQHFYYIGEKR